MEALAGYDVTRFRFLDETGVHLGLTRRYGRAEGGARCHDAVPLNTGTNVTIVATLSGQGLDAVMELDGALTGAAFTVYVREVLVPTLRPGEVVVLDNLPAHKGADVPPLIEACGAQVLFLPPYSPDFTPIELAFSKLKTSLRTLKARTRAALQAALNTALSWITGYDAQNWFAHCGYHIHGH